jgi:heme-degrading monooxygenase HmoA
MRSRRQYVVLWEFQVRRGREREFARLYGSRGQWARLFRRARGYVRTDLLRDHTHAGRYLTIDAWNSRAAYAAFRWEYRREYAALDARCEKLTVREHLLGQAEL